jgi:hypothetical protein
MINSIGSSTPGIGMMRPPQEHTLTEDQKAQVASILSDYDASSLTSEDAQTINTAFKEAGIKPGADMFQAIQEAGFDASELRELDPSMASDKPKGPPPPPPTASGNQGLNTEALSELQSILEKYNFEDLSSEDETNLISELDASGFLLSGLNLDTLA